MLAWRLVGATLLGALILPACSDDAPPPPPPPPGDGGRDTSVADSSTDAMMDSSVIDSSVPDTSLPTGDCRVTDILDIHTEPGTMFREVTLSAGAGADGFMVAYALDAAGRQNFFSRHIPTSGAAVGDEVDVSQLGPSLPGMARGGAVTGLGTDWLLLWADNRLLEGDTLRGINIHSATESAGGGSPSAAAHITTEVDVLNDRPSVQMTADGYLVIWNRRESSFDSVDEAYSATLGPDGSATGPATAVAGMTNMSGRVALGALLDGVAAAWVEDVDESGSMRHVRVLAMDRDGTPRGTPTTVTLSPNAAGVADYAGVVDGGGVVYDYSVSTRLEVRYRAIDVDGATVTEPRSVVPAREQGRAPSIGILGGNALVAYRSIDGDDEETIQLVVVDGFGAELGRTTVATIEDWTLGEVHVLVDPLGRGLVVWNDQVGGDYLVRGARIDCSEEP